MRARFERLAWAPHAFSLELRGLLSYRLDFWMKLVGTVASELGLAYFLWKAMFETRGVAQMGGYSFRGMMLYYLLVPLVARMIRGEDHGFLSTDIYEGGLTRYLVYPLSFLQYKYVSLLALSFVSAVQLVLALAVFALAFGVPAETHLSLLSVAQGFGMSLAGTVLYFLMAAPLEMVSFWQDSVWSLMVMLRFTLLLFGGGFLPLTLFPDRFQAALHWLPFSYLISVPIRCFLGQVSGAEWLRSMAVMLGWIAVSGWATQWVWRRGTRQYSGVGL